MCHFVFWLNEIDGRCAQIVLNRYVGEFLGSIVGIDWVTCTIVWEDKGP